jgi:hypothetical protein
MGLKERVLSTVVNNLMLALSASTGAFITLKAMPWLINSGLLHVTVVMK